MKFVIVVESVKISNIRWETFQVDSGSSQPYYSLLQIGQTTHLLHWHWMGNTGNLWGTLTKETQGVLSVSKCHKEKRKVSHFIRWNSSQLHFDSFFWGSSIVWFCISTLLMTLPPYVEAMRVPQWPNLKLGFHPNQVIARFNHIFGFFFQSFVV